MLLTPMMLLFAKGPVDGLQRFKDFVLTTKSFSVQVTARSEDVPGATGRGTLLVQHPDSFRFSMDWGGKDYNYVKSAQSSIDYAKSDRVYEDYPGEPGLQPRGSTFSEIQQDSIPIPLLTGDLQRYLGTGVTYKLTSNEHGVETYTAMWSTNGTKGKVIASIGQDGRLLHFDDYLESPTGSIHRIMDFSNYVVNPQIPPNSFSTVPPLGCSIYQFPPLVAKIAVGDILSLGKWETGIGVRDADAVAKGKLIIVRETTSRPADDLVAYLAKQKLPVESLVFCVGSSGGQFWSPSPNVGQALSSMGTPISILLGSDGKIIAMWLGYDPDHPEALVGAVSEALKGKIKG